MEQEIEEIHQRYQAKRQPILDAIEAKKRRQQNFWTSWRNYWWSLNNVLQSVTYKGTCASPSYTLGFVVCLFLFKILFAFVVLLFLKSVAVSTPLLVLDWCYCWLKKQGTIFCHILFDLLHFFKISITLA